MTKTFEQCLDETYFDDYYTGDVLWALNEWLTQKLQEIGTIPLANKETTVIEGFKKAELCGKKLMLKELLSEFTSYGKSGVGEDKK